MQMRRGKKGTTTAFQLYFGIIESVKSVSISNHSFNRTEIIGKLFKITFKDKRNDKNVANE